MLSLPPIRLGERTVCLPLSPLGSIELANLWLQAGAGEWRSGWNSVLVHEPALALWAVLAQSPRASVAARHSMASATLAARHSPVMLPSTMAHDAAADKRLAGETVEPDRDELNLDVLAAICQQWLLPAFQSCFSHGTAGTVELSADPWKTRQSGPGQSGPGQSGRAQSFARRPRDELSSADPLPGATAVETGGVNSGELTAALDGFDPSAWADGLWALRAARRALRAERSGLTGESWTAEWLGDAQEWVARAQATATEATATEATATEATATEADTRTSIRTGERSAGAGTTGPKHLPNQTDHGISEAALDRLDRLAVVRRKRRLGPLPELPVETKRAILARWSDATTSVDLLALARRLGDAARQAEQFRRELAQEKLMALRDFAYGASHEINNPLANIATRAQGLIRDELDPERRRSLAVIASQALRAHAMIADMMLFAKPPALRCARVALDDLPPRIIAELSARAAEQGSTLAIAAAGNTTAGPAVQVAGGPAETTEPAAMTVSVWADRDQLLVALRALVENSLEALGRGGRVEIAVWASPDGMCGFRVSDTGPGVPAEARSRLFDPYYSGREAGRGLGLGLCKAWRIATDHGGRLSLDEQFSSAASFVLGLPRHA